MYASQFVYVRETNSIVYQTGHTEGQAHVDLYEKNIYHCLVNESKNQTKLKHFLNNMDIKITNLLFTFSVT